MDRIFAKIKNLFKRPQKVAKCESCEIVAEHSTAKRKHKHIRFYERTLDNDIKYRGPLSYRYLRLIGWICQICFVSSVILLTEFVYKSVGNGGNITGVVFSYVGELAVPCFLLANFALILTSNNTNFKKQFLKYGIFILLIWLLLYGFFYRYFLQIVTTNETSLSTAAHELSVLISATPRIGYVFNTFVDLIMCLLVWFFLTYRPKKLNKKQQILFRLLVIIPILYELTCIAIKLMPITDKDFLLPFWAYPLITSKPPFTFLAFIIIAFYLKFREKLYLRKGKTIEEYDEYLKTNANSLSFSVFTSLVFLIVAVLDIITLIVLTNIYGNIYPEKSLTTIVETLSKSGIGKSSALLLFIPIVLLFSYTKKHKPGIFDTILPIAGIILVVLAMFETLIDAFF